MPSQQWELSKHLTPCHWSRYLGKKIQCEVIQSKYATAIRLRQLEESVQSLVIAKGVPFRLVVFESSIMSRFKIRLEKV